MGKITAIRDLDEETFRKLRAVAVEENMKVGDVMNNAMKKWLAEKEKRKEHDSRFLIEICGIIKPGKKVRWSEEVDEILYG
ncbi:MAG: hypothetical protein WC613_03570 [Candidatus Aenigmatarchaeota archaeon]